MADEFHDEDTLFKVLEALMSSGLTQVQAADALVEMQNEGILFRQRKPETVIHIHQPSCPPNCPSLGRTDLQKTFVNHSND